MAYTFLGERRVRIWEAHALSDTTAIAPGTVLDARGGIEVATGNGVLGVDWLQLSGAKRMHVREFINAHDLQGHCFDTGDQGLDTRS